MIHPVQGDLLQADVEALVNPVNLVGAMGKGLALQFKEAFPETSAPYTAACKSGRFLAGEVLTVALKPRARPLPKYVIHFPTKRHWREKSRMEDVVAGLTALVHEVERLRVRSIAVPPLGCGLGGLDWNEVRPLIQGALGAVEGLETRLYFPADTSAAFLCLNESPSTLSTSSSESPGTLASNPGMRTEIHGDSTESS